MVFINQYSVTMTVTSGYMHHDIRNLLLKLLLLCWLVQAAFLFRQLRTEMETAAESACFCSSVWGNMTLIPEHIDILHNVTLLSDNGCHIQEFSLKNENLKVDIEVDICFHCFEMYLQ